MDIREGLGILWERIWDFNFIFKFIAWCLNKYCLAVWSYGISHHSLPVYNAHQLAFFYFVIPAYNIVLSCMCIVCLLGEVPQVITQRVFLVVGFSLYIVTGGIGFFNFHDSDFQSKMLVMSILCITNALVLIFDYVKAENFFVPKEEDPFYWRDQPVWDASYWPRSRNQSLEDARRRRSPKAEERKRSPSKNPD